MVEEVLFLGCTETWMTC